VSRQKAGLDADAERWAVTGSLTVDSVSSLLHASAAHPLPGASIVDLGGVDRVDSAAVALLLAWRRRAATEGRRLVFSGVPPSMASLAALYGVQELLVQ
jgi:phospholipid transport system transporter-binding protein